MNKAYNLFKVNISSYSSNLKKNGEVVTALSKEQCHLVGLCWITNQEL